MGVVAGWLGETRKARRELKLIGVSRGALEFCRGWWTLKE